MTTQPGFETMLGLTAPWKVEAAEIDHERRSVTLRVVCESTVWGDPDSGGRLHIHSHEERRWRHLDFWQYETVLIASVPCVLNPEACKTQVVTVPWAGPGSRWTLAFEALALVVIQASRSIEAARRHLRLSWDAAPRIIRWGVEWGMGRRPVEDIDFLGVDEKSFARGPGLWTVCLALMQ